MVLVKVILFYGDFFICTLLFLQSTLWAEEYQSRVASTN